MQKSIKIVSEGAVMVALALALSFLELRLWPQGGSVDLVMLPLIVFALRRGVLWGIGGGLVFGVIYCIISGGVAWGWAAMLLDYFAAYAVVGLAGLLSKMPVIGALAGSAARFAVHLVSGVVIWAQWMPEEFFGLSMSNIWIYSALYNGSYMLGNALLAAVGIYLLSKKTKLLCRI